MSKINVLIFPDGEVNSAELHDALATCVNINLYGASSVERHGRYLFRNHIPALPKINEPDFYDRLNDVIKTYSIDVLIPTHDTVSLELIENRERIKCIVLGGDKHTAHVCRSKKQTYDLLKDCDFVPGIYADKDNITYPAFIKPDEGQGSKGAKILHNASELEGIDLDEYVVCEFLPGEEFTVDCLTDKNGNLCFISPRSRQRTLAGICTHGRNEQLTDEIRDIARTINSRLKFSGLWYFQIKRDANNKFKLLEISNRCAGTMCLTRARGVNLPLLSVYVAMGREVKAMANPYNINIDRTLINRYEIDYQYDAVYFDLDDTIIVNDEVNLNAIRFLYQCFNKKIPVYLLTKHAHIVPETLSRHAIAPTLFKEIIHIPENLHKSDFIRSKRPILIDNAFAERDEVANALKIPVFDVDAIEVLLDWRI